ncbi:hypothetical protein DTL42_21290 [Bremerella cremea]|uniref:Uncharacterized protein n=1 Tax=Bremerella cremea TaxID=1031537 RepID=A0A368KK20_9BACT|nr:hypothetical protein [Bremerella cremea]RCS41116.1 hypothetical protein DTL42_21290 [Bremerella cremea]
MVEEENPDSQRESSPALRFGCGAILAAVICIPLTVYFSFPSWPTAVAILAAAVTGGWLTYRFGDQVLIHMLQAIFSPWGPL